MDERRKLLFYSLPCRTCGRIFLLSRHLILTSLRWAMGLLGDARGATTNQRRPPRAAVTSYRPLCSLPTMGVRPGNQRTVVTCGHTPQQLKSVKVSWAREPAYTMCLSHVRIRRCTGFSKQTCNLCRDREPACFKFFFQRF